MQSTTSTSQTAARWPSSMSASSRSISEDLITYLRDYARQKPESAALWCFGIGFVLGWKLKPW